MAFMKFIIIAALTFFSLFVSKTQAECSGDVDICDWTPWLAWSDCNKSCGGGTRKRDRRFCCKADLEIRQCMEDCNMDYDYHRKFFYDNEDCNNSCYNGGTYRNGNCYCSDRYKGTCCGDVVTCGRPSSISHGTFSTSDNYYTYGARVTYRCNSGYGMRGYSTRTCNKYGSWTGSTPTCLYAVSCNSSPCKNGATCVNKLGGYTCTCKQGWTGRNCDSDIQHPVVSGCPEDRVIVTGNMKSFQTWTEPKFTDPHGTTVHVTKNYQTNSFEFPWGEFNIQFSAVKPSNGYRNECKFKISVKPHPCKAMEAPINGLIACNNWRRDYTQACIFVCKDDHTLPPGYKPNHFFMCGATGKWLPSPPVKKCYSKQVFQSNNLRTFTNCTDPTDRNAIGAFYISLLKKSGFNALCERYPNDCKSENVLIRC